MWPNPPAIARIRFLDLFTGEKVDPNLFSKKKEKPKQKWMDRLAGERQTVDEIKIKELPFQLIRHLRCGGGFQGPHLRRRPGVGAVFIFNPETKDVSS